MQEKYVNLLYKWRTQILDFAKPRKHIKSDFSCSYPISRMFLNSFRQVLKLTVVFRMNFFSCRNHMWLPGISQQVTLKGKS